MTRPARPEEKERVAALEASYDRFYPVFQDFQNSLERLREHYASYSQLQQFYGSEEWFALQELDMEDVKRGVLSEDQLYDLIIDHNQVLEELLELVHQMYKER